jgi:nucleoside-diphosphate-sugar epimerase
MRVFITGGSGHVGSAVTNELIANGHEVTGLARSDASAAKLEAAGAKVVRGELGDLDTLTEGAREADGVIHCGFIHDFANYGAAAETDRVAIETFGAVLKGTGKPLLVTSGLAGLSQPGQPAIELTEVNPEIERRVPRVSEKTALRLAADGVNASVVRLPPTTHGDHDHGFIASLIGIARDKGAAAYVGEGANHWAAGHVLDAARVYRLALESPVAGRRYHVVGDAGVPFRDIAAVIGRKLGVPVKSVTPEEAPAHFGWMAPFAQLDALASGALTEQWLGFKPSHVGLIEDMETGTYF